MDKTPNEYIRWRYAGGEDREAIAKDTMKISDAELELQKTVRKRRPLLTPSTRVVCTRRARGWSPVQI